MIKTVYNIFFIISVLTTQQLHSQSFNAIAYYDIKLAEDEFYFEGILNFNHNESLFSFKMNKESKWLLEDEEDPNYQVILTDSLGHQVYRNYSHNKIMIRSFCIQNQPKIYEDVVTFDWKLGSGKKKIGEIVCQDAHVTFRGREYEVWYSLEIPINAGPWKFFGLPGLIVSVSDKRKEVSILLKSLNNNTISEKLKPLSVQEQLSMVEFNDCLDKAYDKHYYKNQADIARLQAKFPELEITDNNMSKKRIATELEY